MIAAKYKLDKDHPYIVGNGVRADSIYSAKHFKDKSEARRVCLMFGYELSTIEFVEVM